MECDITSKVGDKTRCDQSRPIGLSRPVMGNKLMTPKCLISCCCQNTDSEGTEAGNIVYNYEWRSLLTVPPSQKQDNSAPSTNIAENWTVTQTLVKILIEVMLCI